MSRIDDKWAALRDQGFTGAIPEMTLQWLQANGATSNQLSDAWMEMLASQGYTGQRNDAWFQLLFDRGYDGAYPDRDAAFWADGGIIGEPLPPVDLDNVYQGFGAEVVTFDSGMDLSQFTTWRVALRLYVIEHNQTARTLFAVGRANAPSDPMNFHLNVHTNDTIVFRWRNAAGSVPALSAPCPTGKWVTVDAGFTGTQFYVDVDGEGESFNSTDYAPNDTSGIIELLGSQQTGYYADNLQMGRVLLDMGDNEYRFVAPCAEGEGLVSLDYSRFRLEGVISDEIIHQQRLEDLPEGYFHDFRTDGIGAWNHTRDSIATAPDESGIIIEYTGDEPAFYRDQGLQLEAASENLSRESKTWANYSARGECTANPIAGPDDIADSGRRITIDHTGGGANDFRQLGESVFTPDAPLATQHYIRKVSETGEIRLSSPQSGQAGDWTIDLALLGSGWEWVTDSHPAVTVITPFIGWTDGQGGVQWSNRNETVIEFDLAHVQQEDNKEFPSSYIPTEATAVTRNATTCQATFDELGLPAAGVTNDISFQIAGYLKADLSELTNNVRRFMTIRAEVEANGIQIHAQASTVIRAWCQKDGVVTNVNIALPEELLEGDMVDIRFRASSTDGLKMWIISKLDTVTGEVANTEDFTNPLNIALLVGRNHLNPINVGAMNVALTRILPYAASDDEIVGWPGP